MLYQLKKRFPSGSFARNVLTLMTGTTIAQAIPIAISPILTRLYTPDDFGIFALYMAIASILSVIATGRYELAIILPETDEDAANIAILAIILTFCISFIMLFFMFIFNSEITELLGHQEISPWLYFVPLTVLLTGIYQVFYYWANRKKHYREIAKNKVLRSTTTSVTQIGFSFGNSFGLIAGMIAGQSIATVRLGSCLKNDIIKNQFMINRSLIYKVASRFSKFPKYLIVAHTFNTASAQMPVIMLSSLFSTTVSGFYALTYRVISLPMSIIGGAIGDVFRQRAADDFVKNGHCQEIYIKTLKHLTAIAILPSVLFFFIAPDLFALFFSENWRIAGEYARLMTIAFFFQFITSPLSSMFMIAEKQELDLVWQIFRLLFAILSILLGYIYFSDANIAILFFSISFSLLYFISAVMTYRFSCG